MEYYVKQGAVEGGDGSEADPFVIVNQASVDTLLAGTYTNSTAASSGDIYTFEDGDYPSNVRYNSAGTDGLTFRSKNLHGANLQNPQLGSSGTVSGGNLTRSVESTTFEKFKLTPNWGNSAGSQNRWGGGTLTIRKCLFTPTSGKGFFYMGGNGMQGIYDGWLPTHITFQNCVFHNGSSNTGIYNWGMTHGSAPANGSTTAPSTFTFEHCTIVSSGTQKIFGGAVTGVLLKNVILAGLGGTIVDDIDGVDTESSNVWGYQYSDATVTPYIIGTSNPLFVDPSTLDFSLRPDSPCINKGSV